jgi:hypothetical protein
VFGAVFSATLLVETGITSLTIASVAFTGALTASAAVKNTS